MHDIRRIAGTSRASFYRVLWLVIDAINGTAALRLMFPLGLEIWHQARIGTGTGAVKHKQDRAAVFAELEKLMSSLCSAKQAALNAAMIQRLENQVEFYIQRVEALDDPQ
ncbi:unnamed protein product [Phytophthora fragariaefolia]|uniref:Unnamed protein product n=1 Tax=Phytophthora fragariaefolia TaxID=1490495 RepID=A0A9W7DCZ4_9STRA|nr:unnamed protein product [Phytophthora fragariaefolia]